MRRNTRLSWSSGKDSAWALHVLHQSGEYEVTGLLTTINAAFGRVAMHAVRVELLRQQAEALGLPLYGPALIQCSRYGESRRGSCLRKCSQVARAPA